MVLEKVGTTIGKEIIAWTKTSGSKSLLAMRPIKINTVGLKLAPVLEKDSFQKKVIAGDVFETRRALSIENSIVNNTGIAFKKVKKASGKIEKQQIPVEINAVRDNEKMVTYNFFDGDTPIGFVQLEEIFDRNMRARVGMNKDYPELGIRGSRVIVHMLQNYNEKTYAGIGNLADKVAVQHCLNYGIEPNILSEASYQSHLAHFLRGKRFFPYRGVDYNKDFEQLAKNRTKGEHIDTSEYGSLLTYMPREMVEKLKAELISCPLFSYKV